jgi:hypothetical protein
MTTICSTCRKHFLGHSSFMTYHRFVTRLTRQMSLVEQELFTPQEHLSSPPVHFTRSLVLWCVVCPFVLFSFGLCVLCSSSIYGFWLPFVSSNSSYCAFHNLLCWTTNLLLEVMIWTLHVHVQQRKGEQYTKKGP